MNRNVGRQDTISVYWIVYDSAECNINMQLITICIRFTTAHRYNIFKVIFMLFILIHFTVLYCNSILK